MEFSWQEYWSGLPFFLQWTTVCQNSSPCPVRLGWSYMAWLMDSQSYASPFAVTRLWSMKGTVRRAIIKKSANNKCWRGCGVKRNLPHCWWECKFVQPLRETVWRFLSKLKIELPYDPSIWLLGIYLNKTIIQNDTCYVHSSTIHSSQNIDKLNAQMNE